MLMNWLTNLSSEQTLRQLLKDAITYSRRNAMLFIDQEGIRQPQLTSPKLDDPTWEKIRGFSGLPDEARSEVNDYIRHYREELRLDAAHSEYATGGWWKNLAAANELELRSLEMLQKITANPNFLPALAIGLDGQDIIPAKELDRIRRWLDRIEKEKEKLAVFYENALKRLHHDERSGGWQSLLAIDGRCVPLANRSAS
jgi:hypothetical protein